ncbi:hypothetical protein EUGRSUZ_C01455 [Eucalyptus grandis]|uniref:Uncharacterized protein n=2 Tax=Eucalyptus grandis TaxID=71139 RepID=A0ACC3LDC6_EUCGR|nr:hypothetical protein EUGRSUZ_C01455 [Eucalyptus grandis]
MHIIHLIYVRMEKLNRLVLRFFLIQLYPSQFAPSEFIKFVSICNCNGRPLFMHPLIQIYLSKFMPFICEITLPLLYHVFVNQYNSNHPKTSIKLAII